jgi:hypothetical protein
LITSPVLTCRPFPLTSPPTRSRKGQHALCTIPSTLKTAKRKTPHAHVFTSHMVVLVHHTIVNALESVILNKDTLPYTVISRGSNPHLAKNICRESCRCVHACISVDTYLHAHIHMHPIYPDGDMHAPFCFQQTHACMPTREFFMRNPEQIKVHVP